MQAHPGSENEESEVPVQIEEYQPPEIIQVGFINRYLDQKLESLNYDEICEVGREARNLRDFSNIVIGRLALSVEKKYGETTLKDFANNLQMDVSTVSQYRWVASKFPEARSYNGLSYSYFRLAAGTQEPQEWIKKAVDNNWNVNQFRKKIKGELLANECSHDKLITIVIEKCDTCGVTIKREVTNATDTNSDRSIR